MRVCKRGCVTQKCTSCEDAMSPITILSNVRFDRSVEKYSCQIKSGIVAHIETKVATAKFCLNTKFSQVISPGTALIIAISKVAFTHQKFLKQCYRDILQIEIIHKPYITITNRI